MALTRLTCFCSHSPMQARTQFLETLSQQKREQGALTAFLAVRLEHVNNICMTYGIKTADLYVQQFESLLVDRLRNEDVVGRIGDNDFGVYLSHLNNAGHALLAARKLAEINREVITINGIELTPQLKIGIAVMPDHGDSFDKIHHAANLALGVAETERRDFMLYSPEDCQQPGAFLLEKGIGYALNNEEFSLYCQPKLDLKTDRLYGGEVLLRWHSSQFGQVNTQRFIDVLENSRHLVPVTNWVIHSAVRQCAAYQKVCPGFSVAINLSSSLLNSHHIIDMVNHASSIWAIKPSRIVLEVTESAMMKNPEKSRQVLSDLHGAGYRLSIDDFGTGYSSLAYLKDLPVDELKIDRSFIMDMKAEQRDLSIVEATINLAHSLDLRVVAEGVEDARTLQLLKEMGCDYAQGYFIARPMPVDDCLQWIAKSLSSPDES